MDDDRDDIVRRSSGVPGGTDDRADLWQDEHLHAEALSEYLDEPDTFGPRDRAAIDLHLAACDECRTALAELRALVAALAALPEPALSRSFAMSPELLDERDLPRPFDAGRRPIELRRTSARRGRQIAAVRYATAAAAVLFVLVLGADLLTNSTGTNTDDDDAEAMPASVQQQSFATDAAPTEDAQRNAATEESATLLEAPLATPAGAETMATTGAASQPTPVATNQPAPQPTSMADAAAAAVETATTAPAAAAATTTPTPATGGAGADATPTETLSAIAAQPTEQADDEELTTGAPAESADGDQANPAGSSRSGWRTLELGLALLLACLLTALVVLPRLGSRRAREE